MAGKIIDNYNNAINWLKRNTIDEQGIIVSSSKRVPYLEVTGYLIPTLIEAGEYRLAEQYAEFLCYMQRPNGAFAGPDGKEYVFDSGQALRGLLSAYKHFGRFKTAATRTAEYIISSVETNGRIASIYGDNITEYVHVYILPALVLASEILDKPEYSDTARRALVFYRNACDILDINRLNHFLAYIIDGLIEMQEVEFTRGTVEKVFASQRRDGSIPAFPHVNWTCSTGTAQFAAIGYKLGLRRQADRMMEYLCKIQNPSGGFYGSYGRGKDYFKETEISWANKFFLDACHLKNNFTEKKEIISTSNSKSDRALDSKQWHDVITKKQDIELLAGKIKSNCFPVWIKPLLRHSSPEDSMLELGSGTGELSVILGIYDRKPYLLDYSQDNIKYAKALFEKMGLKGRFFCRDILEGVPMTEESVDWVWSSGLLEHFPEEQIIAILEESVRISQKGVMTLVPNANSIFYRIGKLKRQREANWHYGREEPIFSLKSFYKAAGLKNIKEYSIGVYHSLDFWGADKEEIRAFYDSLDYDHLQNLNQGYLLFICGEK